MSLQKQLVHLNMSGGLQKKDDQLIVIPSKLAVADNVEFDDASTVISRGGQRTHTLANATTVLESVGEAQRIFSNNGAAIIQSKNGMHRLTEAGVSQVWNAGGADPRNFPRAALSTQRVDSILQNTNTSAYPLYGLSMDMAVISNTTCIAWESRDKSTGLMSVKYRFATLDTGVTLVTGTLNTIGTKIRVKPRVLVSGTKFVLMYGIFTAGGTSYEIRRIVFNSDGTVSSAEASIVTSTAGVGIIESANDFAVMFDATISLDGVSMGLVYRDSDAAKTLRFREISQTTFLTTAVVANVAPSATPTSLTAHVSVSGGTYKLHAFMSLGATTLRAINMNLVSAALSAETTVGTGVAGSVTLRSTAIQTTSGGLITVAWDSQPATQEQSTLRISSFDTAYGTLTECSSSSPWFVAGSLYQYDSRLYVPMCFAASDLVPENTYFVVDVTSVARNLGTANTGPLNAVARIDYGESPLHRPKFSGNTRISTSCLISNGVVFPYPRYETDLVIAGTRNDTAICVALARLDYTSQLAHAEANGLTFLAGACPLIYDGQYVVEEGFHHAPVVAAGSTAAAGTYGPLPVGTSTIVFTYGWQDARGNWHESAPSVQVQVVATAPAPYYTPLLVLPPTLKTNAVVRIYRTKASSTDTSLYLSMDTAGNFVSSDTDLASSEQLYTAGNVLPNTPAPACRHVSLFQKRLVLSGCGDGSRIYYSKPIDSGFGVEFSSGDPSHQGVAPPSAGRVVGTCELDDSLVVLCEDAIGVVAGSGPSPTGLQGEYSTFGTRSANLGCDWNSPKSILRAPEGVWFRSPYGIRFFARQGQIQVNDDGKQMGADVDPLVSGNIVAIAGGAKQQARFYSASSATCLVYDYQWQQWTRFTGMSCVDAVYADGRYYHLSNVGTTPLLRYTDDAYNYDDDDSGATGQDFYGYIETPWLSFAGLQGFQRIYRLLVLARSAGSGGTYNINGFIGYDFANAPNAPPTTETFTGNPATTANVLIQMQHHFAKQKCETLKIGLQFKPVTAGAGRLRISDLTLQVGAKAGYFKMPASQRY